MPIKETKLTTIDKRGIIPRAACNITGCRAIFLLFTEYEFRVITVAYFRYREMNKREGNKCKRKSNYNQGDLLQHCEISFAILLGKLGKW